MSLQRVIFIGVLMLGAAVSVVAAGGGSVGAEEAVTADTPRQALERGLLSIDLRYRLEFVDSASFEKDALASTLRGALTFETTPFKGLCEGSHLCDTTARTMEGSRE